MEAQASCLLRGVEGARGVSLSDVQARGGNLNPNGRGLTEQVRGCPHRAAGEEDAKVPVSRLLFLLVTQLYCKGSCW
jgi:hypothetical protein